MREPVDMDGNNNIEIYLSVVVKRKCENNDSHKLVNNKRTMDESYIW